VAACAGFISIVWLHRPIFQDSAILPNTRFYPHLIQQQRTSGNESPMDLNIDPHLHTSLTFRYNILYIIPTKREQDLHDET